MAFAGLTDDIRFAVRQLIRQRGSTIVAVLTLALGIGASTALFSVIDAAILRPLPYPNPERLVTVMVETVQPDGRVSRSFPSLAAMRLWQESTDVFAAVAMRREAFNGRIVLGAEAERVAVSQVTESYLSLHGVTPVAGRDFTKFDTAAGAPDVALLGHGYWRGRFGGRLDTVGEMIRLDDGAATIVGVLPPGFDEDVAIVLPIRPVAGGGSPRGWGTPTVYGRLVPGVTIPEAVERLSTRMSPAEQPDGSVRAVRARVRSRLAEEARDSRTTVNVLACAVALILLIACVNVAGLVLARGAARQPELALRAALGAARTRLVRQLLTESAVLALAGGGLGVLFASVSLDTIVAILPLTLPADSSPALNVGVLAASVALLIPTTVLFGLAPAIRLSRASLVAELGRAGRQPGTALSRRGGQVLIATEVALAVILVAGAGLMLRSFARMYAVDLGFKPGGLVMMEVLPLDADPAVHQAYYTELVRQVRAMPGIGSVGLVDRFALGTGVSVTEVVSTGDPVQVSMFKAMPGYLETIGAALGAGRLPTDEDVAAGVRGAVINESAARMIFSSEPAVGREFRTLGAASDPWTVIGVIADFRHGGPRSAYSPQVFFPFDPVQGDLGDGKMVLIRPRGATPDLFGRLRRTAQAIGPRVLVERVRTADELFGLHVVTPRRRTILLSLLGGLGLVLAIVGVFGMTAYAVGRRTVEVGVRMACGGRPGQMVWMMVRDAANPIAVGTAAGLGGALLGTRAIESFLFETTPTDPGTFAAVALTLVTAGGLAALVPALRAARVDPVAALRAE